LKISIMMQAATAFILLTSSSLPVVLTDVLAADVIGNGFDNTLYGTMYDDLISGKDGNDNLFGVVGDDEINGGPSDDFIQGDEGNDNLYGNDGNDLVQGGAGNDTVDGGAGNDTLIPSFVTGSTTIRDFEPDTVICGDGLDTAFISLADNDTATLDCEIVVDTPNSPGGGAGSEPTNKTESEVPTSQDQKELFPLT
jgi:Ca2+-binding RTX toxin-like protein